MRAIEFKEYGGPEVLGLVEVEVPEPGPGQVSIDVAYGAAAAHQLMGGRTSTGKLLIRVGA